MTSTNKRDSQSEKNDVRRDAGGEVELLPLPEADTATDKHERGHGDEAYTDEQMRAYARANVEHALAESRAECERWKTEATEVANGAGELVAAAEARAKFALEQKAANHWFIEANKEHNRAERAESRSRALAGMLQSIRKDIAKGSRMGPWIELIDTTLEQEN